MGGFSGTVPEPALAQVKRLVSTGQLRFFLLGGGSGPGQRGGSGSTQQQVSQWVRSSCSIVPAKGYGGSAAVAAGSGTAAGGSAIAAGGTGTGQAGAGPGVSGTGGSGAGAILASEVLYRCGTAG